jgi:hypothetical protein
LTRRRPPWPPCQDCPSDDQHRRLVFDHRLIALVVGFVLVDEQEPLRVFGGAQFDHFGLRRLAEGVPKQHRGGDLHPVHADIGIDFIAVLGQQFGDVSA